jgi:hypothetical protein
MTRVSADVRGLDVGLKGHVHMIIKRVRGGFTSKKGTAGGEAAIELGKETGFDGNSVRFVDAQGKAYNLIVGIERDVFHTHHTFSALKAAPPTEGQRRGRWGPARDDREAARVERAEFPGSTIDPDQPGAVSVPGFGRVLRRDRYHPRRAVTMVRVARSPVGGDIGCVDVMDNGSISRDGPCANDTTAVALALAAAACTTSGRAALPGVRAGTRGAHLGDTAGASPTGGPRGVTAAAIGVGVAPAPARAEVLITRLELPDARALLEKAIPTPAAMRLSVHDSGHRRRLALAERFRAPSPCRPKRALSPDDRDPIDTDRLEGAARLSQGVSHRLTALTRARARGHRGDRLELLCLNNLGMSRLLRGRYDEALAYWRAMQLPSMERRRLARGMSNAGICYSRSANSTSRCHQQRAWRPTKRTARRRPWPKRSAALATPMSCMAARAWRCLTSTRRSRSPMAPG